MKKHSNTSVFMTYTMVGVLCAAISFITMIIMTRTVSEDFFGKINKFITASNLVMSLVCVGLDSAYIRFYYEPPEKTNSKHLAWECMVPTFIILILVSFIIVLLRNNSSLALLLGGEGLFFAIAFVFTILSLLLNRFMTIYFRMSSKIISFSILSLALAILTKTIFIPIYFITSNFEHNIMIAALFLASFMIMFFLFNKKNMIEKSSRSFTEYKSVYRFAFLSSPVFIITYLNNYLPQVVISHSLGDNLLGIYSAALLFCSAILVLSTGFSTFWSPYMYKNYNTKQSTIKKIHDVALLGSVIILSLILIFSDFIYLFIGETFRKNQNILGMLLIYPIVLILVETTAYGISIKKKNEISLLIYLISTTANVVLCFILISKHGLDGVAFASMISAIIQMLLMTYFGQKYYQSITSICRTSVHIITLIVSAILFYVFYDHRIVFVITEIAMVVFCLIYDKDTLSLCYRHLKNKSSHSI